MSKVVYFRDKVIQKIPPLISFSNVHHWNVTSSNLNKEEGFLIFKVLSLFLFW
jgi:hypothetical protein